MLVGLLVSLKVDYCFYIWLSNGTGLYRFRFVDEKVHQPYSLIGKEGKGGRGGRDEKEVTKVE